MMFILGCAGTHSLFIILPGKTNAVAKRAISLRIQDCYITLTDGFPCMQNRKKKMKARAYVVHT